jgi:hypothetical protein
MEFYLAVPYQIKNKKFIQTYSKPFKRLAKKMLWQKWAVKTPKLSIQLRSKPS